MINRHIIATGMSRTGTFGMAKLFKSLIGNKNAHHQQGGIVSKEEGIKAYNLDNPSQQFVDCVMDKKERISAEKPHFDANWQWSMGIYLLEKYIPSLRFFMNLRDPIDNASSLKQRRWLRHKVKGTLTYEQFCERFPDEVFIDAWIKLYEFLIVQVKRMKYKPFILDFDCYIQGIYNELFLDIFGIKRSTEILDEMQDFLTVKFNTGGDYENIKVDEERQRKAYRVQGEVVIACKNHWIRYG